jgi:xanthine dehydrogenase accessory factor
MSDVYERLLHILKGGDDAVLVTRYGSSGITRTLRAGDARTEAAEGRLPDGEALRFEQKGGEMLLAERFRPRPRLIIFGGGHIAVPLAAMAAMLKFDVTVFDDRPSFANEARFPDAAAIVCDYFENAPQRLAVTKNDYVVIATRGHRHDQQCLRHVLNSGPPQYAGMIGSRRRAGVVRRLMREEGFAEEALQRLHSPIGLEIGAVTPEEIAVSVLAEIVREMRKSSFGHGGLCRADMDLIARLAGAEEDAALVTVLSTKGSTPREAGAKMMVFGDGRTVGTIGGGCAEADVMRDARMLIPDGGCLLKTVDMTDSAEEDGMVCGGVMKVLIEVVRTI